VDFFTNKKEKKSIMQIESLKISYFTVYRLSTYLRVLSKLDRSRVGTITSVEIGEMTCTPDTQVRKDLAYFGQFGKSGTGYDVKKLKRKISEILGTRKIWHVALIGVGSLGRALLAYPGFKERGFYFVAAFDIDKKKIGKQFNKIIVQDMRYLEKEIKEKKIKIGTIAVPASNAQQITNRFVDAGVECIFNFAPIRLKVMKKIRVRNIDLASEIALFSFYLKNKSW